MSFLQNTAHSDVFIVVTLLCFEVCTTSISGLLFIWATKQWSCVQAIWFTWWSAAQTVCFVQSTWSSHHPSRQLALWHSPSSFGKRPHHLQEPLIKQKCFLTCNWKRNNTPNYTLHENLLHILQKQKSAETWTCVPVNWLVINTKLVAGIALICW